MPAKKSPKPKAKNKDDASKTSKGDATPKKKASKPKKKDDASKTSKGVATPNKKASKPTPTTPTSREELLKVSHEKAFAAAMNTRKEEEKSKERVTSVAAANIEEVRDKGVVIYTNTYLQGYKNLKDDQLSVDDAYSVRPQDETQVENLMRSYQRGALPKELMTVMQVDQQYIIIDGRHRKEARRRLWLQQKALAESKKTQQAEALAKALRDEVPVVVYAAMDPGVCYLYSVLVNNMQALGATQSTSDDLYAMYKSISHLEQAKVLTKMEDYKAKALARHFPAPAFGEEKATSKNIETVGLLFYRLSSTSFTVMQRTDTSVAKESFPGHYDEVIKNMVQLTASLSRYKATGRAREESVAKHLLGLVKGVTVAGATPSSKGQKREKNKYLSLGCFENLACEAPMCVAWLPTSGALTKNTFTQSNVKDAANTKATEGLFSTYVTVVMLMMYRELVVTKSKISEARQQSKTFHELACVYATKETQAYLDVVNKMESHDAAYATPIRNPHWYMAMRLLVMPVYTTSDSDSDMKAYPHSHARTHTHLYIS
jgi:hypothetical protein